MTDYKSKDEIKRQQLKNNFLKRVIIRFDYTSIVNVQRVLDQIVGYMESIKNPFLSFDQMATPKDEVPKEPGIVSSSVTEDRLFVYRFSDCQVEPKQDVTLDFARNFLCLDIRCDGNYTVIDDYLEMMSELLFTIVSNDSYVQLTRIGIRKIDGVDAISPDDADNVFEFFSQQLDWKKNDLMKARQYTDIMKCLDVPAYVNYSRIVRALPGTGNLRFTLDIDCYKDTSFMEKRPNKALIDEYLHKMNGKLFDLFLMGIKLGYLNQNL